MARLGHAGSSVLLRRELFPSGFAAEVMQLIWKTWKVFVLHRDVRLETRITALFRNALIDAYVAEDRSWFITLEDPLTDPLFGTEEGRNDLNFFPPQHYGQKIFFTLECKRLNITTSSGFRHNADKYVSDGVKRFVNGQYSAGLPCGAMLGYVMDARVNAATRQVESELSSRKTQLRIETKSIWKSPSITLPSCVESADTAHVRGDGEFALHHLFVSVSR